MEMVVDKIEVIGSHKNNLINIFSVGQKVHEAVNTCGDNCMLKSINWLIDVFEIEKIKNYLKTVADIEKLKGNLYVFSKIFL